ncbi:Ig-like domain-containing protein, partial [Morganella morganii]|uniref:Ig-like domain-containing protein n=1 Tax=Morganella morganii TaxID=582 RepID=UPI0013C556F8
TLKDVNGNLVSGQTVLFSTGLENTTFGAVTDNQDGTYTAGLKGTKAGDALLTVTVSGTELAVAPVTVKLTADSSKLDKDKSVLSATPLSIVADNTATSALTLTLKDVNGNLVSGQTVLFSTGLENTTFSAVTDNQDGTYTAGLKGIKAGDALLTVTVSGTELAVAPVTVKLTADSSKLDKDKSALTAAPLSIVADNTATSALTLTLKDVNGNLVSGQTVLFSTGLENTTFSAVTDNQDGTYTAGLKGTKAGDALLTVTVSGTELAVVPVTVELTADNNNLDGSLSKLTATPNTIMADSADGSTVLLDLRDVNNNPVPGQTVVFYSNLSRTKLSTVTDHNDGIYSAVLTGTLAGTSNITVEINGVSLSPTASVKLKANNFLSIDLGNMRNVNVNQGFPTTGFKYATFTLITPPSVNAEYDWVSSHPSYASVDSQGKVTFISEFPAGIGEITILANPKSSSLDDVKSYGYTINVKKWFVHNQSVAGKWNDANNYCQGLSGGYDLSNYGLLTPALATNTGNPSSPVGPGGDVKIGTLYGEWDTPVFYDSGWQSNSYWAKDGYNTTKYRVSLRNGDVMNISPSGYNMLMACVKNI